VTPLGRRSLFTVWISPIRRGQSWGGVRQWLTAQSAPADPLTYDGNGALVWIRQGSVADWVGHAAGEGVAALVKRMRGIYGC
jgi:hypothetical protein